MGKRLNCWYWLFLYFYCSLLYSETLTIAVSGIDSSERYVYDWLVREFESQHPSDNVELVVKCDNAFKQQINLWLSEGKGPDLINWHAGERLFAYVRQNKVKSLKRFWQSHQLYQHFDHRIVNNISYRDKPYAIPISFYTWGLYYRKSVLAKLHLSPPQTWQDLTRTCEQLSQHGIIPFVIGTKHGWTAAAWFDYINLRLNGYDFHRQLLKGLISYNDSRVSNVLALWKTLIDKNCFIDKAHQYEWVEPIPMLYRGMAGFTFIGSFFNALIPKALKEDIAIIPFPMISHSIEVVEEAPIDLFFVPYYSKDKPVLEKFMVFISSHETQAYLNQMFSTFPPHLLADVSSEPLVLSAKEIINQAKTTTQFFDRDTHPVFSNAALPIFVAFMKKPNIAQAQSALEKARIAYINKVTMP